MTTSDRHERHDRVSRTGDTRPRGTSRFSIIEKLGEGGNGVVYMAYDRCSGRRVAVKMLRYVSKRGLAQLKREFRTVSNLSHPNIITLYELVREEDSWLLTMEWLKGRDFLSYVSHESSIGEAVTRSVVDGRAITVPTRQRVGELCSSGLPSPSKTRRQLSERVDLDRLRSVLAQLSRGLAVLHHAGIVHRDLKHSNVLVTDRGRAVLMDFGIAAVTPQDDRTPRGDGEVLGTPAFMAPEQIAGAPVSAASDWYGLGIMLYEALTGRRPYSGPLSVVMCAKQVVDPRPPSEFCAGIPSELETLCIRLLARDPDRRPTDAQVLDALDAGPLSPGIIDSTPVTSDTGIFVGRRPELARLADLYLRTEAGGRHIALIRGAEGMGKSALMRRFTRRLERRVRNPAMLSGSCHERENLPYKAFDRVIDQLARRLHDLPAALRERVAEVDITALSRVFPTLREVGPVLDERTPLAEMRERLTVELNRLLAILSEERPIVICIEDLQWADPASLYLLLGLLRGSSPRLLVVTTLCSEAFDPGEQHHLTSFLTLLHGAFEVCDIELQPLSVPEQQQLAAALLGPGRRSATQLRRVWQCSEGHPLLLGELARYVLRAPDTALIDHNPRVEDVLWWRIDNLPRGERSMLELIAIAGEPLPLPVLADCCSVSVAQAERMARCLRVNHLARTWRTGDEAWLEVCHTKVRKAVRLNIVAPDYIAAHHRRLALALQRWNRAPTGHPARSWSAAGGDRHSLGSPHDADDTTVDPMAYLDAVEFFRSALLAGRGKPPTEPR